MTITIIIAGLMGLLSGWVIGTSYAEMMTRRDEAERRKRNNTKGKWDL